MRADEVEVRESVGKVLSCTIFHSCGRKLLSRGHVLTQEDARVLEAAGLAQVWVTGLEEGEIGEDEAVMEVAGRVGHGAVEVRLAPGGRANLLAREDCCVLVDDGLVRQVNGTSSVVIATVPNFSHVKLGQRIASVKSLPFAVPRGEMEAVLGALRDRGPIAKARPTRGASVGILYCDPINGERARDQFEGVMRQRLERIGAPVCRTLVVNEQERVVARALEIMLRCQPSVVLVASTTAPAGPEDVVGSAMKRVGGVLERFLAPVEPGSLLLLAYKGGTPLISAPGCFRSPSPNVLDLLLPPLLVGHRVSSSEVAALGHGGLMDSVQSRWLPPAGRGAAATSASRRVSPGSRRKCQTWTSAA